MDPIRQKAFDDWWVMRSSPEERLNNSAIWNAACEWMKFEVLRQIEEKLFRENK